MNWENTQRNVAQQYCGSVLVLDDAIYSRKRKDRKASRPYVIKENFAAVKAAFENHGALCDLWHVEDHFKKPKTTELIIKAADRSDMLIIDWYLGRGKQDPTNAITVLRELCIRPGFRFAAIHSDERSERVIDGLKEAFGDQLVNLNAQQNSISQHEEDEDIILTEAEHPDKNTSFKKDSPSTFRIGQSLYVCVLQKSEISQKSADLAEVFYDHLAKIFSDHLHWAGFEFAAKTKQLLPTLLQSLPTGTDAAIMFECLLLENEELSDCIIDNLTLELNALMKGAKLATISDKTVLERLKDGVSRNSKTIRDNFPKFKKKMKLAWRDSSAAQIKMAFKEDSSQQFKAPFINHFPTRWSVNGLAEHKEELTEFVFHALGIAHQEIDARAHHDRYAALREHLQSVIPKRLMPGVVLRLNNNPGAGAKDMWLVCVSPACDCAHGDGKRPYLFVGGDEIQAPQKGRSGTMQSCLRDQQGKCHHVKWSSKKIQAIKGRPEKLGSSRVLMGEGGLEIKSAAVEQDADAVIGE